MLARFFGKESKDFITIYQASVISPQISAFLLMKFSTQKRTITKVFREIIKNIQHQNS